MKLLEIERAGGPGAWAVEEVVAGECAGARVWAEFGGGKDERPGPLARGVGAFAGEGFGPVDLADTGDEVLAAFFSEGGEVVWEAALKVSVPL